MAGVDPGRHRVGSVYTYGPEPLATKSDSSSTLGHKCTRNPRGAYQGQHQPSRIAPLFFPSSYNIFNGSLRGIKHQHGIDQLKRLKTDKSLR